MNVTNKINENNILNEIDEDLFEKRFKTIINLG